jgi:catechol 2,3-dioxygenase-like lactoylglutathione lyase family enzyme
MARRMIAILPCNDLEASEAFYRRLGLRRIAGQGDYRILADSEGAELHLTLAPEGWLVPGSNPMGLYLYAPDVDALARAMTGDLLGPPEKKPWGMYEFAVTDPDETLVRVGRPIEPPG